MPVKTSTREDWVRMRSLTRMIRAEDRPLTHGTRYAYNHKYRPCRCDKCRRANREYLRNRKASVTVIPPSVHGTENGYVQFQCHCEKCKKAATAARRERYQRSKTA